jgi:hypothetical protein
LGLESARPTLVLLQSALTATMDITRTRAPLTATTVLVGSPTVSLSGPARGSAALMDASAFMGVLASGQTSMTADMATVDEVTSAATMHVEVTQEVASAAKAVLTEVTSAASVAATPTAVASTVEKASTVAVLTAVASTAAVPTVVGTGKFYR